MHGSLTETYIYGMHGSLWPVWRALTLYVFFKVTQQLPVLCTQLF